MDAVFCSKCGKEIPQITSICEHCAAILEENIKIKPPGKRNPFFFFYSVIIDKYATFDGRAQRNEFWYFSLVNTILLIMLFYTDKTGILLAIYQLATFLPSVAVAMRRMHDTGRSFVWILFPFVNLIFLAEDSQVGENDYGPDPKAEMRKGAKTPPSQSNLK